jgi:hypothetical protein
MITRTVFVTTEFIGFHHWPEVAAVLAERAYLANLHRHKFFVRVELSVSNNNRQVEFHDLKDNLDAFIGLEIGGGNWPARMSCEDMAEAILAWIHSSYPSSLYVISVAEDNENGSIIRWEHSGESAGSA